MIADQTIVVTGPAAISAFSASDGSALWSVERDGVPVVPAIATVNGAPAVLTTDGRGPDTATIDALDLRTGTSAWDAPVSLEDESRSGVTVDGSRAFVGDESGNLYAVDIADGTIAWTVVAGGSIAGPVAAGSGVVVAVVPASDTQRAASVVAFDEATGDERWNVTPDTAATFGSLPVLTRGAAVVAFPDGEVVALSLDDGAQVWGERIQALVSPLVSGAVAGDDVVFADSSGGVHLVSPVAGREWVFEFNEPVLRASPVVAAGSVIVGFEDGSIGAVSLRTGHLTYRSTATGPPVAGIALTQAAIAVVRGGSGRPELASFGPDPDGVRLDEVSPTEPNASDLAVGLALAMVVAGAIVVPGRLLVARTPIVDPSSVDDDGPRDDGEVA